MYGVKEWQEQYFFCICEGSGAGASNATAALIFARLDWVTMGDL